MTLYLGIDPGVNGAIAWLLPGYGGVGFKKMPDTERDLFDLIGEIVKDAHAVALVERIGSIPGMWDAKEKVYKLKTKPSSFGTLMRNYGALRMALIGNGVPLLEVETKKWQAHYGLLRTSKTESDTLKKNRHKAKAQQLCPNVKITHANADALLIANYCALNASALFHQAVGA
jgi:hypothetical protein